MFAFTDALNPDFPSEVAVLHSWEAWFASKGIQTARVQTKEGVTLYREGDPHTWPGCKRTGCECYQWPGPREMLRPSDGRLGTNKHQPTIGRRCASGGK